MSQNSSNSFYIIDAHGFLHRYYHALPKLSTSSGEEVGALYGFARLLMRILRDKKPACAAVCFDSPAKTFRHGLYDQYKANRPKTDEALVAQLALAREVAQALGFKILAAEGYEADDLIACAAGAAQAAGLRAIVASSDKDVLQLVGKGAEIWTGDSSPARGPEYVRAKYGIEPAFLCDYFALVGDSSDNVPGVRGIGPKMAAKLITANGGLDSILAAARAGASSVEPAAAKKLLEHEPDALLSKKLVTLDCSFPVGGADTFVPQKPDPAALAALAKRLEFRDFLTLAQEGAGGNFLQLPAAGSWDAVLERLPDAGEFFFQAVDGAVIIGFGETDFAVKPQEDLAPADREPLNRAFANPGTRKLGHYLKEAMRAAGLELARDCKLNCFDTALAAYCLNPSRSNYDFPAIAAEYTDAVIGAAKAPDSAILQNLHVRKLAAELEKRLSANALDKLYRELEIPLLAVLACMEQTGMLLDTGRLAESGTQLARRMEQLQAEVNAAAGMEVNINSPKQIAFLLFEKLGLKPLRKNKTGYSTDEEVLSALAPQHPAANLILQYREAAKLKSTYVDSLLALARDSRVHTRFDQTGTATGRLSSLQPNLQNIPVRSESGRLIRRAFVAGSGKTLLSADYSQIDLRVLAHESADGALVEAFRSGGDIHARTAAEVFGCDERLISADMRRAAKAINFGIVYGQSAQGLSAELGIPRAEAQQYIDHYFATYKGVREWIDAAIARAGADGFVRTMSGRIRRLPEFTAGATAAFARRAAVNTIIQGGSSDIIKNAMLAVQELLAGYAAQMTMQVHDELIFEVPPDELAGLAPKIKSLMENACALKVPLVVDLKSGPDWGSMKPYGGAA